MKAKKIYESLNESIVNNWSDSFKNIKDKIKKSKKLPTDMKEKILERIIFSKFGTQYKKGVVFNLKGSPGKSCSLGAD